MSAAYDGDASGGRLAANIVHFARVLRAAGVPVGPGRVLEALSAVDTVGVTNREDFYWTLHAVFVNRRDQRPIFDQAFHVFWRNPQLLESMLSLVLPGIRVPLDRSKAEELLPRVAEALRGGAGQEDARDRDEAEPDVELDAVMTWSDREILREMDFEKMSGEEIEQAKRAVARLRLPLAQVPTRRFRSNPRGARIDMRASLRASLRTGGGTIPLRYRKRRRRRPPLVFICDISGSMARYSRMMLHFMHAVTNDRDRVFTFVFGTRLNNITRHLRFRDVDEALDRVADAVEDWSGGTRIGHCLHEFNNVWSRRVLGQGAVVLLITDGLDRDAGQGLEREMERLRMSSRRVFWLNPLLRYDRYEPKSRGARVIVRHVDDVRTIHNLEALAQLSQALSDLGAHRDEQGALEKVA